MSEKKLYGFLEKFSRKEKESGRSRGLTDKQFSNRKNFHWDNLFGSGVTFFKILIGIFAIWIILLLIGYSIYLFFDFNKLEQALVKISQYILVILATLGGNSLIERFKR